MAITKQQGEVVIHARLVATSTAGEVLANNLTLVVDHIAVDGVEISVADKATYASEVTAIAAASKAMYVAYNEIAAS